MRVYLIILFAAGSLWWPSKTFAQKDTREYYQIRVYHFSSQAQQQQIETYLSGQFIPVLHRNGYKHIGVFVPVTNDTAADKKIYVFFHASSPGRALHLPPALFDSNKQTGSVYLTASYDTPPYARYETIILKAFRLAEKMNLPVLKSPKDEHIYELRSYESATEKLYENKVTMFNEGGEIRLFKRLQFNAVFYADVISGSRMPNLMYMTSFENMDERNAHWKSFSSDPEWKRLSSLPEYQHNVSKAEILLLKALPFSDF